ncbi:hypothetical protein PMG11_03113 [Penicillium brasilianum]|uniref:Pyrroline-5-carboxylate reductase catalytic N-terminal domain-containing protein n=1 Tax=Penicillium brasilianum TaxID=104259 RepID=A0A0F7V9C0_PENBI|nr:hypothetical protein PMG11_03113 [Penicillium brasilianum]
MTDTVATTVVTFLGCGVFGTAILRGVVSALEKQLTYPYSNGAAAKSTLKCVYACVRTHSSAQRIRYSISEKEHVKIVVGDNAHAVQAADVVVLCCRPGNVGVCLGPDRVRNALRGKLLISDVAGLSIADLSGYCGPGHHGSGDAGVYIVRVMANLAAMIQESITVATMQEEQPYRPPPAATNLAQWIFEQVGRVM